MNEKRREGDELYRFMIISPLLSNQIPRGGLKRQITELSGKNYEHPERGWERVSAKTIEEWYYRYRKHGLDGLGRKKRSDSGESRAISGETGELIIRMKKENPKRTGDQILRELTLAGRLHSGEVSRSSVYRLLNTRKHEITLRLNDGKELRKFSFEFSNECWQCDVCHGPYLFLNDDREKKKVFIYAFIDDASRIIPHAGIALQENLEHYLECLKLAFMKKGLPGRLYMDNASYFRNDVVRTIGARLGIRMLYCTPYSP